MTEDAAAIDELVTGDLHEWTAALPKYQQSLIDRMLEVGSPTEVALAWLESAGPKDTAPYGGIRAGARMFYDNLLKEIQELLCDGAGYERERKEIVSAIGAGKLMMVGMVSTAIAPQVGAVAAVIGPAVALILAVLANSGKATACEALDDLISERASAGESQTER